MAALGAEVIAPEGFAEHGPFDVILELVGAPNLAENLQALATGGRIAVIGVAAGAKGELNLLALMGKRARIHGSTLRARPLEEKALAARRVEHEVLPLFEAGALRVPVAETFPLERGRRRLRALRGRRQARQDRADDLAPPGLRLRGLQYGGCAAYQSPSTRNAAQNARLASCSSSDSSMFGTYSASIVGVSCWISPSGGCERRARAGSPSRRAPPAPRRPSRR